MLLRDCSEAAALVALDRVREATPGAHTCSAGVATWDGTESAAALLRRADEAMYTAKRAGRDSTRAAGAPAVGATVY